MNNNRYQEDLDEQIAAFVEEARKVGYISLDDIPEFFPEPGEGVLSLEHLLQQLDEAGIEVYSPEEEPETESDEFGRMTPADATTLYFHEVGPIPLLTREEEAVLAKDIESGKAARLRLDREELSTAERAALEQAVEAGETARCRLITANARLVISLAKSRIGQGVPLLDLIQEGNMGLMRAVEKFDWRRGHKFSTYATWWIRQALTRAVADQGRTIRLPLYRYEQARKLRNATRELVNELGRDPTAEELAEELDAPLDEVERLMQDVQSPTSLDMPVGEYGESQFGELLESSDPLPVDMVEEETLSDDIWALLDALPYREARIIEMRYGLRDGREYTLKEVGDRFGLTRERIRQIENDAMHRLRNPRRTQKLRAYLA
jgi:RNA polymerase primary sigma factor